ncbi:GNAT family N-acetyltransferase [Sporolactobacillus shoreicorticis]|nr:GNAT family N-acetyltransferase [Sporolactobacillus shoreicorticis]
MKGRGRQLMDFAVNHLKDQNYHKIFLWVFEENQRARKFYEKHGYTFDGTKEQLTIDGKQLTEMRYVYQL